MKDDKTIVFDIKIPTPKGVLYAMYLKRETEIAGAGADVEVKMTVAEAHCMMVGYALNHAGDTYWMWDKNTSRVHKTRDVIWLKRMYFEKKVEDPDLVIEPVIDDGGSKPPNIEVGEGENQSVGEGEDQNPKADQLDVDSDEEETEAEIVTGNKTRSGRQVNNPTRLIEEMGALTKDYKIELTSAEHQYYSAMKELGELKSDAQEFGFVGAGTWRRIQEHCRIACHEVQ